MRKPTGGKVQYKNRAEKAGAEKKDEKVRPKRGHSARGASL